MLILVAVAGVGLAAALWLPTRNDTASATENGSDRQQSQGRHESPGWPGTIWHRKHDRHRHHPSAPPTASPTAEPPTLEPPTSQPPTSQPPTTEPTSPEPPVTTPPPPPTTAAPDVTAWAPFTDYTAGQLVSFAGKEYQVQQTHTSLPGWEPPKLPDLFKLV
jgi:hypothetical protein